jgi:hypothetical protein
VALVDAGKVVAGDTRRAQSRVGANWLEVWLRDGSRCPSPGSQAWRAGTLRRPRATARDRAGAVTRRGPGAGTVGQRVADFRLATVSSGRHIGLLVAIEDADAADHRGI